MPRRPRVLAPQVLYHVIVRGNHRQVTFRTPDDYHAYLDRLGRYLQHCRVRLRAYCLMPNHVNIRWGRILNRAWNSKLGSDHESRTWMINPVDRVSVPYLHTPSYDAGIPMTHPSSSSILYTTRYP